MPFRFSLEPVWTAGLVGMVEKKKKLAVRENPRKDNLRANLETSTLEKKITSRKIIELIALNNNTSRQRDF